MPLPKLKYIVAPSVDFMLKQSYPNTEEEDPSKFVLPMPQSIRVNLVCRGALDLILMVVVGKKGLFIGGKASLMILNFRCLVSYPQSYL